MGAPEERLWTLQCQGAAQVPGVSAFLGWGSCQSENLVVELSSEEASGRGDGQMRRAQKDGWGEGKSGEGG